MIWKHKLVRMVISSWAFALAVSVVPVDSVVSGNTVVELAPSSAQTNSAGCCVECRVQN